MIRPEYLSPTSILDSDHPELKAYMERVLQGITDDPVEKAVKLYYAVRDDIWYDPYSPFYLPDHYLASKVLKSGRGFCISKAGLLCALGRAAGIPSRIGFADVKNHIASPQLLEHIGSDLFVFHGYTEFYLKERWIKATPAFNMELCRKQNVDPLEFNGLEDSIFQPYNSDKQKFMEYVNHHGEYSDIPVKEIVMAWKKAYGSERVQQWIDNCEQSSGKSCQDFKKKDIYTAD